MQTAFTLGQASHILGKFITDNALFPPEQKDTVYDKGDLLPVYMHGEGTRENPYYFDKKLSSEDNDNDEEIEVNKVNKENKENIPDNELPIVHFSNKVV